MGITNKFYSKVSLHADRLSRITLDSHPRHYSRWMYDYLEGIAKVANVVATQNGNDVDITWTPRSSDFTNYYVYSSDDGGANYSLIATVADETAGTATYINPGEGQYSFYVVGDNSSGAISPRSDIPSLYLNLAPSDPSNLAVTAENEQAVLTWDASVDQNLDEYIIKLDGVEVDRVSAGATLQHTYTGLTNGSTYTFGVQAIDALGATSNTTTIVETVLDTIAPSVPTGLAVTAADRGGDATWDANSEADIDGYNVYVNGVKNNGSLIAGTSYTATGLTPGVPADIQVSAVDTVGNESALSSAVSVTALDLAPSTPTGLGLAASDGQLDATWDANTDVDLAGYNIYVDGVKNNSSLIATNSYSITGLTNDIEYDVQVSAVDTAGQESTLSAVVAGTPIGFIANDGALEFIDGATSYINTNLPCMFGKNIVSIGFYFKYKGDIVEHNWLFGAFNLSPTRRFYVGVLDGDNEHERWSAAVGNDFDGESTSTGTANTATVPGNVVFGMLRVDDVAKVFDLIIDGEVKASSTITSAINNNDFYIGGMNNQGTNDGGYGVFDEVFVLSRYATLTEYNSMRDDINLVSEDPDLIHRWSLDSNTVVDEVTGTVADVFGATEVDPLFPILDDYTQADYESFESGLGDWVISSGIGWRRNSGATGSGSTGPSSAFDGSWYVYCETTSGQGDYSVGDTSIIEHTLATPGAGAISFAFHQYGIDQGTLNFEVYDGSAWTTLWSTTGDNGNQWYEKDVITWGAGITKIRFRNVAAGDYRGDVALDDITVFTL